MLLTLFGEDLTHPLLLVFSFFVLGIVPFAVLSLTSFIKLSVVFGILRNALGAQQIPSGAIISLLTLVLTVHIMAPVGEEVYAQVHERLNAAENIKKLSAEKLFEALRESMHPIEKFLREHSNEQEVVFFAGLHKKQEGLFSLMPAFVLSELRAAFAIGFLIFLPFLVVDLVVANLLLGLGMMMVSPVSISLPLKIILFVLCDGWFFLSRGLVLSYYH